MLGASPGGGCGWEGPHQGCGHAVGGVAVGPPSGRWGRGLPPPSTGVPRKETSEAAKWRPFAGRSVWQLLGLFAQDPRRPLCPGLPFKTPFWAGECVKG